MKLPLFSLNPGDLSASLSALGLEPWRVRQVADGLYRSKASEFKNISTLPREIKALLEEKTSFFTLREEGRRASSSGTVKFLLGLSDGVRVECVALPNTKEGYTVCLSSQAGCSLRCAFCASGLDGCERDLLVHEIVEQAVWMAKHGFPATNIVLMGMGEPFLNWENVEKAIRIINDPEGMNIGARNITVSTSGVVDGIRSFANLDLQVRLSVSLHFPTGEARDRWMPVSRANPLPVLMGALRDYQEKTGRQVTFEYILFDGLNDHLQAADDLRKLCAGLRYKVNLIPYNEVPGLAFRPPQRGKAEKFRDHLLKNGVNATIRARRGDDIGAACGQLRRIKKS